MYLWNLRQIFDKYCGLDSKNPTEEAIWRYKRAGILSKTRALTAFLLQIGCYVVVGPMLGNFLLIGFFGNFIDESSQLTLRVLCYPLFGFLTTLLINYRRTPISACLPMRKIYLYAKTSVSRSIPLPNRIFFKLSYKRSTCFAGKQRGWLCWLGISLLLGLLAILLSNILSNALIFLLPNLETRQVNRVFDIFTALPSWYAFICLVISPALLEELVFRARGFALLERAWGTKGTIFISSVCFAAIHLSLLESLSLLPISFYLGWLRVRSGNLLFPMLVHFQNNALAFGLMTYHTS